MEEKMRLLEYKKLLLRCLEGGGYNHKLINEENWSDSEVFEKFEDLILELMKDKHKKTSAHDEAKGIEQIQVLKNDDFSFRSQMNMNKKKTGSGKDHEHEKRSGLNVFNLEFGNFPLHSYTNLVAKPKGLSSPLKQPEKTDMLKNSTQTIKSVKFEYFGKSSKPFENSRALINSSTSSPVKAKASHGRSNSNFL